MSWETELAKAENNSLRISGDVQGIIAKYSAFTGEPVWRDIPLEEVLPVIENSYLNWIDAIWVGLRNGHLNVRGEVTFTNPATRLAIVNNVEPSELEALQNLVGMRQTLAQSLGLVLSNEDITDALRVLSDTPQYERSERARLIDSIITKYRAGALTVTPLDKLQTIDSLIGE